MTAKNLCDALLCKFAHSGTPTPPAKLARRTVLLAGACESAERANGTCVSPPCSLRRAGALLNMAKMGLVLAKYVREPWHGLGASL